MPLNVIARLQRVKWHAACRTEGRRLEWRAMKREKRQAAYQNQKNGLAVDARPNWLQRALRFGPKVLPVMDRHVA